MKRTFIKLLKILSVFIIILLYLVYRFFFSMNSLPKGELLLSVESPNGNYKINAYISGGNATVAESIRCELQYNNSKLSPKNIYWQYRESSANILWLDDTNVKINSITLDVTKDVYDFRKVKEK